MVKTLCNFQSRLFLKFLRFYELEEEKMRAAKNEAEKSAFSDECYSISR